MLKKVIKRFISVFVKKETIIKVEFYATVQQQILTGKVVLITGGGSGIGKAIATKCVSSGARVVISGRNEEKLKKAVAEIGSMASYIVWDICDRATLSAKLSEAENIAGGRIDILVNNAGIADRECFGELTYSTWDSVFETNLVAPVFLSQEISNRWIKNNQRGVILQISSFAGNFPIDDAYAATKNALNEFTFGISKKLAPNGIRVVGIAPGVIVGTEINRPQSKIAVTDNQISSWIPAKRNGLPNEIAEAALYLISDAAAYVYGVVLRVDGGGCAWM